LLSGRVAVSLPGHAPQDLVRAVVESAPLPMSEALAVAGNPARASEISVARGMSTDRLRTRLAGDLETIVRKAMKKEPAERYESVASLADDLRRFLRHEPIAARPDSAAYRARKFFRRHRVATSFACVALAAIVAGILGTAYQARAARDERDYALRQLSRAEAVIDFNDFLLSDAAPIGRPLEVSELLGQAERIARRQSAGSVESRADLLIALGDQFRAMDEPDRARGILEHARGLAATSSDQSIRARSDCALAAALAKVDELTRGKELVAQALASLPDDPRVTLDRIYCLKKASFVAREDGASDSAIARIMEARVLLAAYPYRSEVQELSLLMDLAESYSDADRHADAIPAFEQAVAIMAALGRDQTQKAGTLYNNWGLSLDMSGRPREAEVAYRRAIDLSRSDASNDAVSPMLLINYGRALRSLGRLEEAAQIVDEGLAHARERGFEVVINQSLLLLTSIYREQGDASRSAAALNEAETRLRLALPPDHPAFGSVLMEQALSARDAGRIEDGLALIDRAYDIAEAARRRGASAGNPARVLIRRAEIRAAAGLHAAAAADARLALATFDDLLPRGSFSRMQGDAYLALGRALLAQGQEQEGREALRASLQHLDDAIGSGSPGSQAVRALLEAPAD